MTAKTIDNSPSGVVVFPEWFVPIIEDGLSDLRQFISDVKDDKIREGTKWRSEFDTPYAKAEALGLPMCALGQEWEMGERESVLERCHQVWERNPIAKAMVTYTSMFVTGRGLQITYKAKEVEEIVKVFLKESSFEDKEKAACDALVVDGEIFLRVFSIPNGKTRIVFVPPWNVLDIVTEDNDTDTVVSYAIKNSTGEQKTVSAEDIEHLAINRFPYEKRGRPDLVSSLPWLKAARDWLENKFRAVQRQGNILYDVTLKGAKSGVVQTRASALKQPPSPGSVVIHNDSEQWQILSVPGPSSGDMEVGRYLRIMAIVGVLMPEFFFCYSDDTEVLTNRGWVKHGDVIDTDCVQVFNHETGKLSFERPASVHCYRYSGQMVHVKQDRLDMLVTPNHKMLVRKDSNGRSSVRLPYETRRADELSGFWQWRCRVTGIPVEDDIGCFVLPAMPNGRNGTEYPEQAFQMDDFLRLVGWLVTEGFVQSPDAQNKRYRFGLGQRGYYVDEIRGLLARFPWTAWESKMSSRNGSGVNWEMASKQMYYWLLENVGSGAREKHLPAFALSLSSRQSRILLDTLIKGDGSILHSHRGGRMAVFNSVSKRLVDEVQVLALRCGLGAQVGWNGSIWACYITEDIEPCIKGHYHISNQNYDGNVYCLTTSTGFYVTRRNGRIAIQGNSDGANANLATASAQSYPPLKRFEFFQDILETFWLTIIQRVIRWAVDSGLIATNADGLVAEVDADGDPILKDGKLLMIEPELAVSVSYPDISSEDVAKLTQALIAQASQGWTSNETAMRELGRDPAIEKKRVSAEQAESSGGDEASGTVEPEEEPSETGGEEQPENSGEEQPGENERALLVPAPESVSIASASKPVVIFFEGVDGKKKEVGCVFVEDNGKVYCQSGVLPYVDRMLKNIDLSNVAAVRSVLRGAASFFADGNISVVVVE